MSPGPGLTGARRGEILVAAARIIVDRGLCDIGSAIADEIGASPALIQFYFPSTAALVAEALVYQDQIFHEEGQRRSDRAGSAIEKLGILIDASCPQPPRPDGDPDGWLLWPAA